MGKSNKRQFSCTKSDSVIELLGASGGQRAMSHLPTRRTARKGNGRFCVRTMAAILAAALPSLNTSSTIANTVVGADGMDSYPTPGPGGNGQPALASDIPIGSSANATGGNGGDGNLV